MDLTAKIGEIADKLKNDKGLMEQFQKNPAAAIKSVTGLDLPADQVTQVVTAVKAKLDVDKLGSALGGLFGKK